MNKKKGSFLIITGLLLIAAALSLWGYNLYDAHCAQQSVSSVIAQITPPTLPSTDSAPGTPPAVPPADTDTTPQEIPDHVLDPSREMPVASIDGWDYVGTVDFPSLNLSLPVISDWSMSALKIAPCRYAGTAYTGNFVIAAHNYKSHFGKIRNLTVGDQIIFTDIDRNTFVYEVVVKEVLMPTAVEEMVAGDWDLTLFTCTLGGASRVTIRCEKITDDLFPAP